MTTNNPNSHTNSRYERPLQPYRCGRARRWQKSCWQGPDASGVCGGRTECTPARVDDRYLCRRPTYAGGPCEQGPLPDGSCCRLRPPCVPQPSLKKRRRRYILLATLVPLLALIAFANIDEQAFSTGHLSIEPGPLSRVHQQFTAERGCESCHAIEDSSLPGLARAIVAHNGIDQSCESCHNFAGRGDQAHNRIFPDRPDLEPTQCLNCHSEHHGDDALLPVLSNAQCGQACHQLSFTDFATSHPPFPDTFPSESPGSIQFDHQRHFKRHFPQHFRGAEPQVVRQAKSCTTCHAVEQATREVVPRSYQEICATCHDGDVAGTSMVLAQRDDLTPLTALLLGLTVDDTDGFDEQREEFLERLADEGSDYISELLNQPRLTSTAAKQVAEFLEEFPMDEVGTAWQADETVEITADNGLSADDEAFYYRLNGHGDPFAKNLLELAANRLLTATDEEAQVDAVELLSQLAGDDDGATCGKCHAVEQTSEIGQLTWQYRGQTDRPLSRYTHSPHINLLGLGESCNSCHLVDEKADYGDYFDLLANGEQPESSLYKSNFHPITIEQCSSCHQQNAVSDNCMLCHNYHQSLTLSSDALQRESTSNTPVSDTESVIPNVITNKEQP